MAVKNEKIGAEYRKELKKELLKMAEFLRNNCSDICANPDSLHTAANSLNDRAGADYLSWRYHLVELGFRATTPKNSLPSSLPKILDVILDISAEGVAKNAAHDPFTKLEVNIQLKAVINGNEHLDTWHLDRHITNGNIPNEIHPLYHIQRGGHRMSGLKNNIGSTMILEPPRISHPPLDAILGIDYVLSHYLGSKWQELREDDEYEKLINDAQLRLWSGGAWTWAKHWTQPAGISVKNSLKLSPSLY